MTSPTVVSSNVEFSSPRKFRGLPLSHQREFHDMTVRRQLLNNPAYLELLQLIEKDLRDCELNKYFHSFHLRNDSVRRFSPGDIAGLDSDCVLVADKPDAPRPSAYVVICGEETGPGGLPAAARDEGGHFCLSVGVARIRVAGDVTTGDLIGPAGDSRGGAIVVSSLANVPILGFAMSGRLGDPAVADSSSDEVLVLVSQDPVFGAGRVGADSVTASAEDEALARVAEMRVVLTMLERYICLASSGDQASSLPLLKSPLPPRFSDV